MPAAGAVKAEEANGRARLARLFCRAVKQDPEITAADV